MKIDFEITDVCENIREFLVGEGYPPDYIDAALAFLRSATKDSLEKLADLAVPAPASPAHIQPQNRQRARPPRYIGPTDKTEPRAQRTPRTARSRCRKIHR